MTTVRRFINDPAYPVDIDMGDGTIYSFERAGIQGSVCDIDDQAHVDRLLSITEGFRVDGPADYDASNQPADDVPAEPAQPADDVPAVTRRGRK